MKSFRTELHVASSTLNISYETPICLMGSCFTEHIGGELGHAKIPILQNPFGILYNPFSIANAINRIVDNQSYLEKDLVRQGERWVSFDHHGRFSGLTSGATLESINTAIEEAHEFLKTAKVLFLSLGTANVYRHIKTDSIVANCHKFLAADFNYYLSEKADITQVLAQVMEKLKSFNPTLRVVFTVSPVRHLKDGFVENKLSKATLLLAIAGLRKRDATIQYFPSYEIMMDDLRDYRFYARDSVHPNEEAIEYIFEKFMGKYFDESTRELRSQILKIKESTNHRPFNPNSTAHQLFVNKTIQKIDRLAQKYPKLDFNDERNKLAKFKN